MFTKDTGNAESRNKSHEVLFEHYRTVAYEGANPFRPEHVVRDTDPSFGKLLPTNLDARILDIGCGMGHFLHYLNLKGYRNLMGVEISPEQVDFCRETVNSNVLLIFAPVSFLADRSQSWECIIFKDVIDHLPRRQVIPALSAIFQALTPGSAAIVET